MPEYYRPKELRRDDEPENDSSFSEVPKEQTQSEQLPPPPIPAQHDKEEETIDYNKLDLNGKINFNLSRLIDNFTEIESVEEIDNAIYRSIKAIVLNTIDADNMDKFLGRLEILKHAIIKNIYSEEIDDLEN